MKTIENGNEMAVVWGDTALLPNTELCFTCEIPAAADAEIRMVAKDLYNLYINGKFVCYGPARAAKGYCRVDVLPIGAYLTETVNRVCVYVKSIYSDTLSFCKETPLFGCEIFSGGSRLCTAKDFSCYLMTDAIRRVDRLSRQRGFCEVYCMTAPRERNDFSVYEKIETKAVRSPAFLPRRVSFSKNTEYAFRPIGGGKVGLRPPAETDRIFAGKTDFGAKFGGYAAKDCDLLLSRELSAFAYDRAAGAAYGYRIFAADTTVCGKIKIAVTAEENTDLWVIYDDLLQSGTVNCFREQMTHALKWQLQRGEYTLISFDVYSARYIQIISNHPAAVTRVSVIGIENGDDFICRRTGDSEIDRIIAAGERTFRHNAYDLLTDCPSRERAAWLCDSYFSAKAEKFFTGKNTVEENMLENYRLYQNEIFVHNGIMPMCYPSHITDAEENIPGWILWYVLEIADCFYRTGSRAVITQHRQRLRDIFDYFAGFENSYGFLEKLTGWNMIEWSKASDFTEDVNIPNNILYYSALRAAGDLLAEKRYTKKAERLRQNILGFAFNGTVFCDNLVWENGRLAATENYTRLCQIFAAYFDLLPDDAGFRENIVRDFKGTPYETVLYPTALFIGAVLRIMVLYNYGNYDAVITECVEKFSGMAQKTGTLWELFDESASCNHGFASIIGMLLYNAKEKSG